MTAKQILEVIQKEGLKETRSLNLVVKAPALKEKTVSSNPNLAMKNHLGVLGSLSAQFNSQVCCEKNRRRKVC
uniref:Uncharacterized protein n=1 Tax=Laticauda laticaudata TaxID=8630 RepID=A0A8C5S9V2_LATLA